MEEHTGITVRMASLRDLYDSIITHTDLGMDQKGELWNTLSQTYANEVSTMLSYIGEDEQRPLLLLLAPFYKTGNQLIVNLSVSDLSLPESNSYNFHGQNTSRWLYAGCILYDLNDGDISTHH